MDVPLSTFFLFATAMSVGISTTLLVVPLAVVGRRYFVLMTLLAVVFVAVAVADAGLVTSHLHLAFGALLIAFNVIVPRQGIVDISERRQTREGGRPRLLTLLSRLVLVLASVCGLLALAWDAVSYPVRIGDAEIQPFVLGSASVTSALLLGGSASAMVLGHWYLVLRGLDFGPLSRVTAFVALALAARLAAAGAGACAQGERWGSLLEGGWTAFFLGTGLFVLIRVVFGFLAPAGLIWMTWRCVRLRSNQSATGILYVHLAFVLIGEIIAKRFLVSEGLLL
jgi:hypothetical protein